MSADLPTSTRADARHERAATNPPPATPPGGPTPGDIGLTGALAGIVEYESWKPHLRTSILSKAPAMQGSLYERLGGVDCIAAVIDDALDRHAVNPVLAPRFRGKDLPKLKQLGTQFFCMGAGGPQRYEGRDLRVAHAGLNISEQEFIAAVDDIVAAMQGQGIGSSETNEVVGMLYSLKGDVLRM